ncbi:hypothetical protein OIV83_000460 [Microbotryomycetes sp. JL201]|nr:hypothetical protein OIV83_000460 [Microbotryomycetes sp. JL201]
MAAAVVAMKPPLLYSLPSQCPLPWPSNPSYPIACTATRELNEAYDDSLASSRPPNLSLDTFAQLVLTVASHLPRADFARQLRSLIMPLHDFDKRWRTAVPEIVRPATGDVEEDRITAAAKRPKQARTTITVKQRAIFVESFDTWKRDASKRRQQTKQKAATAKQTPLIMTTTTTTTTNDTDWTINDTGQVNEWLSLMELYETRLQALLLLGLIAYPEDDKEAAEVRQKKNNPERHASTLDPELLLDFLTDRLQIWRVMKDVETIGLSTDETIEAPKKVTPDLDEVQLWWIEVVERRFSTQVSSKTLSHHRAKLFPSKSSVEALTIRTEPEPSPFKARSLLSLDKSARQREKQDALHAIAQSPTMRRLIKLTSHAHVTRKEPVHDDPVEEIFRVPRPVSHDLSSAAASAEDSPSMEGNASVDAGAKARAPRKQDRPRPLSRTSSLSSTSSSKQLFNRREVSLPKRSTTLNRKPAAAEKRAVIRKEGESRKRKNASPKTSMPSFAALGAAFRPGSATTAADSLMLPPGVPPPPALPGDAVYPWHEPWRLPPRAKVSLKRPGLASDEDEDAYPLTATPVSKRKFVIPDT